MVDLKVIKILLAAAIAAAIFLSIDFFLLNNFAWVISMFAHELGHAFTGWILGWPSFPMPMFTFNLDKSYIVQLLALLGLAFFAYRAYDKNKMELCYALIALIIASVIVTIIGLDEHVISYMGHSGAIFFGAVILYYAIAKRIEYGTIKFTFLAFIGTLIILENIKFSYGLMTDPNMLAHYKGEKPIIGHNDFEKIARDTGMTTKSLALLTIINGVIIYFAAIAFALFPANKSNLKS